MFFSNNGPSTRIEKASLDGDARVIIVYKGLIQVISLTVDTDNDKLYWADFGKGALESSNYDGSDRRFMQFVIATEITYYQACMHYKTNGYNRDFLPFVFFD